MKIDYEKFNKKHWFEDKDGNEIPAEDVDEIIKKGNKPIYYRYCFPLEVHEFIDEYTYHPKNPIVKFFCRKSKKFYDWFSVWKERTFKRLLDCSTHIEGVERLILAMANSGDFTLSQAIWVCANACERCINVLYFKYIGESEGYEEGSIEWQKANTECDFCKNL